MLQTEDEKVYIEHCHSCSTHNWCTKHDESKYISYFENCKAKILIVCPEVQVVANQIPLSFYQKFTISDKPKEGKSSFPRLGSFEIYYKDSVIFSKLESGQWPQSTYVANKIREMLDNPRVKVKRDVKTTNILEKRSKSKRTAKSIQPNSSRNISARLKSITPSRKVKKNTEFFKKNEYSDEDFEAGLQEIDDKEVTKMYELTLPFNSLSNKKINYSNKSNKTCEFFLSSSDPVNMMIKEEFVNIEPASSGKFQLRFPPVKKIGKRAYWLRVSNKGQPWECFKFIVSYVDV